MRLISRILLLSLFSSLGIVYWCYLLYNSIFFVLLSNLLTLIILIIYIFPINPQSKAGACCLLSSHNLHMYIICMQVCNSFTITLLAAQFLLGLHLYSPPPPYFDSYSYVFFWNRLLQLCSFLVFMVLKTFI